MDSLQSDSVDDLLFDLYKKEVLKNLKSKMSPEKLMTLAALKDGGVGTSNIDASKLSLDSFLASTVDGEYGRRSDVSESFLCGLNSRLQSTFGSVLSKEVIAGIVGMFALGKSNTASMLEEKEKLLVDVLNFLVDSSCIKMNGPIFATPPLKRKDVRKSPTAPVKRLTKNVNSTDGSHIIDAKMLFPEVLANPVIDGPTEDDCDVVFVKEVRFNDKLNKTSNNLDAMYNKSIGVGTKVDNGLAIVKNRQPHAPFVNEVRQKGNADFVSIPESARFPLTPQSKMVYNAVFSLAKSKHSGSNIVDIGKCNLTYYSLCESMTPGKGVSSYVINVFCRKFFLDKHPNISRKHYFFSQIADVFLSESPNYSLVEKSFSGAEKALKLHECEMLFFPMKHRNHWFLFVVDLKRSFFMTLDSLYSKDDEFSIDTRTKLK